MPKVMHDPTEGSSIYKGSGVFIDKCKILAVEDLSNYPLQNKPIAKLQTGFEPELCLKVKIDQGAFTKDMLIFGKFNWDEDSVSGKKIYKGWKQRGNSVQIFLSRLFGGEFQINDDDSIPQSLLNRLMNKQFFKLRYCTGPISESNEKPSFQDYNRVTVVADGAENELYNEFLESAQFLGKYIPGYFDEYSKKQSEKQTQFVPPEGDSVM